VTISLSTDLPTKGFHCPLPSELLAQYPGLDQVKLEIIGHDAGPLLVIAGPGSGKTFSLVPRTLNLLLLEEGEAG